MSLTKTLSPGLSKPRPEISKWPSVEHKGIWTVLEGWDPNAYTALRWTLLKYHTHGDFLTGQILWLYRYDLNLPLKFEDDEVLIWQCVTDHLNEMNSGYKMAYPLPDRQDVANTYAEQMAKVLGVQ